MFGYVKNDLENTYVKDTVLYQSIYCGLCKGIGKKCGYIARFTLDYDLAFLSLIVHNLLDKDIKIEKQACIAHHIIKRPVAIPDEITFRIANLNVILAYHKFTDDILDNGKGRFKRSFFKKAYKKAKKEEPLLDNAVKNMYDKLLKLEKASQSSIDMVAHPFAQMMVEIFSLLLNGSLKDYERVFAYSLGKWIYLIDALDDFDKDKKKKNFNVLINCYQDVNSKEELILKHGTEIVEIFGCILNDISENAKLFDYKFNHDLIDNIVFRGLYLKTKQIMEKKKCQKTTKS